MTLNDAVKRIKQYSHRGDKAITTDQITQDIIDAINDARRDLVKKIPKRWLFVKSAVPIAIVNPTVEYNLEAEVQEPILFRYVFNNSLYVLEKTDSDKEWFDNVFDPVSSPNRPTHYREINNTGSLIKRIEIFPIPDVAYTVDYEYYKFPTADLAVADLANPIPDIPDVNQDVVWKGGLYYFLKGFDDPAQGQAKVDFGEALIAADITDERDLDSNEQFRWDMTPMRPNSFDYDLPSN